MLGMGYVVRILATSSSWASRSSAGTSRSTGPAVFVGFMPVFGFGVFKGLFDSMPFFLLFFGFALYRVFACVLVKKSRVPRRGLTT